MNATPRNTGQRFQATFLASALVTTALLMSSATDLFAHSWRQFQCGLTHCGYADAGPTSFEVLWEYRTAEDVQSSPTQYGDEVYVANDDGIVFCVDEDNGDLKWSRQVGGQIKSAPVVVGNRLYIGGGWYQPYVFCLDRFTGDTVWERYTYSNGDVVASPVVADGRVYIGANSDYFFCLDADTGEIIWQYDTGEQIWATATLDLANERVYIGTMSDHVICLPMDESEPVDGTVTESDEIWRYDVGGGIFEAPTLYYDRIFVGTSNGNFFSLMADDGENERQWGFYGDIWGSAAAGDNYVYIGTRNHRVYCLDPFNGEIRWSYDTDGNVDASCALTEDHVYAASSSNAWELFCFDRREGTVVWSDDTYAYMESSPALVGGVLYVGDTSGDDDYLVAVTSGSGTASTQSCYLANDGFPANGCFDIE